MRRLSLLLAPWARLPWPPTSTLTRGRGRCRYLWVVLVNWGLSLTQIGLLISIEKFTCYLFELPSGWLADRWGMRKELCLCFVAYIVAFVFYYFGRESFANLVAAAFLYGLGEAMRSGPPLPAPCRGSAG